MSIQVTVGQIPGGAKEVTLEDVKTIAEAIRISGYSADGYELRVNNVVTSNFNHELSDDDIVSLVKKVKGNAGVSLILVNATMPDGTQKKAFLTKGSYIVALKSALSVKGSFDNYIWKVNGDEIKTKNYELHSDCSVTIENANVAAEPVSAVTQSTPEIQKELEEPAEKKQSKKKDAKSKNTEEERKNMIVYVTLNGGEEYTLELPHKARITAVLKNINENAKWKDYECYKNGTLVKLAFMELKDGDKIVVNSVVTPEDIVADPVPAETVTPKKKTAKKKADAEESPVAKPEPTEEKVELLATEGPAEEPATHDCDCDASCDCVGDCKCESAADEVENIVKKVKSYLAQGYKINDLYTQKTSAKNYESGNNADYFSVSIQLAKENK